MFLFCAEWLYCSSRTTLIHTVVFVSMGVRAMAVMVCEFVCFASASTYVCLLMCVCVCVCVYIYYVRTLLLLWKTFTSDHELSAAQHCSRAVYFTLVNIRAARQFSLVCLFLWISSCTLQHTVSSYFHSKSMPMRRSLSSSVWLIFFPFGRNFPDSRFQCFYEMFKCTLPTIDLAFAMG